MLAAVAIMSVTLFLACAFFVIAAGSQAVLNYFEGRPQLNAYFKNEVVPTPQQVESLRSKIIATQLVDSVKYISKEDAFNIYKNLNKQDPLLLEAVTPGMLPASLEVSAKNPNDLKTISELIKSDSEIVDIRFEEDVVTNLTRWTNSLRTIGIVFVGIHLLITLLVILLIVGLKVASRKEEILVMQLMGANMGYIAAPFVWEGITYGVVGAIIAWGTVYLIILYSMGFLLALLSGISILPPAIVFMLQVLIGTTTLGMVIGAMGGFLAVIRFLK
jgi:cell division transport system permease protein